ncbi:MAG: NAD-dependent deacylase [Gammaproteobacteria bacterium]
MTGEKEGASSAPFGNIVVLTGAGISAESGLRTFRAADGLWENHRIEDVATPEGFARDRALVHRFYNARRAQLKTTKPNAAHFALAAFERAHCKRGGGFLLITQNVDDLHERAGSCEMVHLHGELLKMRCTLCGKAMAAKGDINKDDKCPLCAQAGGLRPDIVWFGEMPHFLPRINDALGECDYFVSIGTSGNVYPAAGFAGIAKQAGAKCVELNLEPTATIFEESRYGKATETVPKFFTL